MARRKKQIRNFNKKKVWKIVDKKGNVEVLTNQHYEWITEPTTHFTKEEAESILADWCFQYYKVGEEKEFNRYGYHIVKDKVSVRETYQ